MTIPNEVAGDESGSGALLPTKFIRPNFDRIPDELKHRKNWVLWVPIWTGSKWTKRPIQPSGHGAASTNPQHWSSFETVKRAYERAVKCGYVEMREKAKPTRRVAIGGVGFVFDGQPDQEGFVIAGVDFDKLTQGGEAYSFAEERLKRLGSYKEVSVSGTGVHVILKARPLASGIVHNGVEMYTSGRFFTMTGRTAGTVRPIIAAPEAFCALAEELRVQSNSSGTSDGDLPAAPLPANGEAAADPEASNWFARLPADKQSEVVRHAALHIAKNSKLFELTKHGGNHQRYVKLTLAIARSGVADAEDIFVEAASIAQGADAEGELRSFFQNCQVAQPHAKSISVGTLLHIAHEYGSDFSQWKQIADRCGASVAVYEPGNEEACRKLLNEIVAADPRTFTLGDRTGPLVILRVPEKDALPPETKWEGDLPGTSLATAADVMQRAEGLEWMQRRGKGLARTHPPRAFIQDYLPQMRGRYQASPLTGIARVPHIDDSGEVHFVSGYDPQTGLFHDRLITFDVPATPTRDDARMAAQVLLMPFEYFQFDDPAAGLAVLLSAIFTALERPFLPVAPMFVIRCSMPGTGKGLIVRCLVRLAFDTTPVFITWGGNSEEFEKRLAAILLQAPAALCIDNANGMQIKGDLLESIITEGCADIRPLGVSQIVKVRSRPLITLTGNNPIITGDMARRSISLDILPRSADPERDRYPFNPVEIMRPRRAVFLRAAFIAMRAFRLAGMPAQGLPAVGSFEDWSRRVRDLVYWVTNYDVSEIFRQNKAEDPRRQADAALLTALHQHFGTMPFKAADAVAIHKKVVDHRRSPHTTATPTPSEQAVHEALEDVLGRDVNARLFGFCARRLNGAHNGGYMLETRHNPAINANVIVVRKT